MLRRNNNYFILKEDGTEKLVVSRKINSASNINIHMGKASNSSSSSDLVDSGKSLIVKTAQLIIIQIDNSYLNYSFMSTNANIICFI